MKYYFRMLNVQKVLVSSHELKSRSFEMGSDPALQMWMLLFPMIYLRFKSSQQSKVQQLSKK